MIDHNLTQRIHSLISQNPDRKVAAICILQEISLAKPEVAAYSLVDAFATFSNRNARNEVLDVIRQCLYTPIPFVLADISTVATISALVLLWNEYIDTEDSQFRAASRTAYVPSDTEEERAEKQREYYRAEERSQRYLLCGISRVTEAMACIGRPAVPILESLLNHKDLRIRLRAIEALTKIGPDAVDAVSALTAQLKDSNSEIRCDAAKALRGIGLGAAIAIPALAVLLNDDTAIVRSYAAFALGNLGPRAVSFLIPVLNDKAESVRLGGATALGEIGQEAQIAISDLLPLLQDNSARIRKAAAISLAQIDPKSEAVIESIVRSVKDDDTDVRCGIAHALGCIGPVTADVIPALMLLLADARMLVQDSASQSLRGIGRPAVPALIKALEDADQGFRLRVARVLAKIGPVKSSQDREIIEFFGDAVADIMMQLKVFWEMGNIIKEKGRPVGYDSLEKLLDQRKAQGIISQNLPTSSRILPLHMRSIERLFEQLWIDRKMSIRFVVLSVQGKSRRVTAWTDQAWDAWRLVGQYLNAIGQRMETESVKRVDF